MLPRPKQSAVSATIPALIDVVTGLGFVGVLALGGAQVTSGERTVGEFMSFFTALSLAFQPLRRLGGLAAIMPLTATLGVLAAAAMAGLPPLDWPTEADGYAS